MGTDYDPLSGAFVPPTHEPPRDGRCEFDTGSALGNVRVCSLSATHTVRDGESGGTHGRYCKDHARLSRYRQFGYRSDPAYALVTVEPLLRCYCPGDCGCRPRWAGDVPRNVCGCRQHEYNARVTS